MRVLDLAAVVALGGGLGLASAHYAVASRPVFGMTQVGAWKTWPRSGARDVDPYMRAYLARGVHLPLGAGEGLELIADEDRGGVALDGRCRYLVTGVMPSARGWTLTVTDGDGRVFGPPLERSGFSDAEILRDEQGGLRIALAAEAQSGNWLPLPLNRRFQLRLRLYDAPISSQAGELRVDSLPRITRTSCR